MCRAAMFLELALVAVLSAPGCGEVDPVERESGVSSSGDTETPQTGSGEATTTTTTISASPGSVLLLARVPTAATCDVSGATSIVVQASRIGCVEPPPSPCTLPPEPRPVEGDSFSCPQTDPDVLLGVEVEQPGRYLLETVLSKVVGEPTLECYAQDGVVELVVTEEMLAVGVPISLAPSGAPCP